jgi:septal ring factor EnvC (AmiA/AmiB activator)
MEQEFERRRAENLEACRVDFCSKTDAALVRYKQGREALERQVRDLEADLKGVHETCRGVERALAESDTAINSLRRDAQRLEKENAVMVHQIVEISREVQEARDSKAEARMLHRQCVQMFRGFSARIMEAAHRLGIHRLNLPTVPEDDGSIILFFSQLAEQLDDTGQERSSSDDTTSSGESSSEEAEEVGGDGAMGSSREASSDSSQGTSNNENFKGNV